MDPVIGYLLALLLVLAGLIGMVVPALPGVPLVFAGLLLAAFSDGFARVGGATIVLLAVLTAIALVADLLASAFGTRLTGASGRAFAGAALGALVGLFFGIPGMILGPFLGALSAEWIAFRNLGRAAKAGGGVAIGLLVGGVVKIAVVVTMLGVFGLAWLID